MAKIAVAVGRDLRAAAADVAEACAAADTGHPVASSDRILFQDGSALCKVLTPKRYELRRHLLQAPETGIRPPARALGRDVERVHDDGVTLAELNLVTRSADGSVSSEIVSTIRIAA